MAVPDSVKLWRKLNSDKYLAGIKKARKKNREGYNATCNRWRKANPERVKEINKRSYEKHKRARNLKKAEKRYIATEKKIAAKLKRKGRLFECRGEKKTLPQWCRDLGLNLNVVKGRVYKSGMTIERALTTGSLRVIKNKKPF